MVVAAHKIWKHRNFIKGYSIDEILYLTFHLNG